LQRWIYDRGWTSLHDAQERAIGPILDGDRDVIVAAATAAGKTEAAFLPICSAIARPREGVVPPPPDPWSTHDPWADADHAAGVTAPRGVEVLYVSPLKALINDQYDRLELLCERADVAVHRWHGDVAGSAKQKLLRSPSGVLLITPESLEALFVNRGTEVPALLHGVRYVVVDELHAFLGTPRGAQLQSLLQRVELAIRRRPPRIGLSATLGDMGAAAEFLRPGHAAQVVTISSESDGQELRLQVRGYRATAPRLSSREAAVAEAAGRTVIAEDVVEGDHLAIRDHLFTTLRGHDNLVFANSRGSVEVYADLLRRRCEDERVPNEFWPHHGSLAKDMREQVEAELKDRTRPVTAVCTSTLEMGIDIGSVASVAQVGPPPSVAALRQRLGRSGRRDEPAVIRIYIAESDLDVRSSPVAELRTRLVQTVAMVRLLLRRWVEPPVAPGFNLSTLVQQTLSLIAQHGGVQPLEAHRALCGPGPFERVDPQRFSQLLRSMAAAELVSQAKDGTLLHGPSGERFVNHHSFYAAFATSEDWRLFDAAGGRLLGSIPISHPLAEGMLLIFAGRRWRIAEIDPQARLIELRPAPGGRPPAFGGSLAAIDDTVRREMVAVYRGDEVPGWLDEQAKLLLGEARDAWRRFRLGDTGLLTWGNDTVVFPWVGDRALVTAGLALGTVGIDAAVEGVALLVPDRTPTAVAAAARQLASGAPPSGTELARGLDNLVLDRWDWVLDDELAAETAGARQLDVPGAWDLLGRVADDHHPPAPAFGPAAAPTQQPSDAPVAAPAARPTVRPRSGSEFCVVDVETTGFSPRLGDRVVEVAAVRMQADGTVTDEWSTLVNPRRDVGATHVHGITATDLVDAPLFGEIAGDLLERLDGAVLTAHNLRFDQQFLVAEVGRCRAGRRSGDCDGAHGPPARRHAARSASRRGRRSPGLCRERRSTAGRRRARARPRHHGVLHRGPHRHHRRRGHHQGRRRSARPQGGADRAERRDQEARDAGRRRS
jgi:ATP-dependent Lhr-like helicase